jgi:hypothetical protein
MSRGLLLRPFTGTVASGAHVRLNVGQAVCDGTGCQLGDFVLSATNYGKCTIQAASGNPGPPGNESVQV